MKNKKFLAGLLAMALILALNVTPAFAAGELPGPGDIDYTDVQGTSSQQPTIPVYGYIGEDAEITDDDPDDPNEEPTVNLYEINVSVPVKIIWAAFESDGNLVTAPSYHIKNNAHAVDDSRDVDVKLVSFTGTNQDATDINSNLTLNLTGDIALTNVVGHISQALGSGELAQQGTWNFSLDGTWSGGFATTYNPTYSMVLEFSID
jgi:hypothetical protein